MNWELISTWSGTAITVVLTIIVSYIASKTAETGNNLSKIANKIAEKGNQISNYSALVQLEVNTLIPNTSSHQSFSFNPAQSTTLSLNGSLASKYGEISWIGGITVNADGKLDISSLKSGSLQNFKGTEPTGFDITLTFHQRSESITENAKIFSHGYLITIDGANNVNVVLIQIIADAISISNNERGTILAEDSKHFKAANVFYRTFNQLQMLTYEEEFTRKKWTTPDGVEVSNFGKTPDDADRVQLLDAFPSDGSQILNELNLIHRYLSTFG